jgi:hypothetical protein
MKRLKKLVMAATAAATLAGGLAAPANANPAGMGCESTHWGFLGFQLRTICDGPRQPDGSWMRYRVVWVPAHYVAASSYCGTYSCSYSAGGYVDDTIYAKENYVVFDSNVLPDEPGWLPPGTDILR